MSASDLVVVNANDPQMGQVDWLVRTLRDPRRGAYDGPVWLLTTGVGARTQDRLRAQGVEVVDSDLGAFERWPFARALGAYEHLKPRGLVCSQAIAASRLPEPARRLATRVVAQAEDRLLAARARWAGRGPWTPGDPIHAAFDRYRRKHFSKFGLAGPLTAARGVERVLLLDSDVVFQRPVSALFDRADRQRCLVEYEKEPIVGSAPIARSNRLARGTPGADALRFGRDAHEVNVGMLCASRHVMLDVLAAWQSLVLSRDHEHLYVAHHEDAWHEQDFFRLLHDLQPSLFSAAGTHLVYHAVHAASLDLEELDGNRYRISATAVEPALVHFAGGSWRRFPAARAAYERALDEVLEAPLHLSRVALYGSGSDADRFVRTRAFDEEIVAVVDGACARQGSAYHGLTVEAPASLVGTSFDRVHVALPWTHAVVRELGEAGVPGPRIGTLRLARANRRRLDALAGAHHDEPLVVVASGPSLRFDDLDRLAASGLATIAFDGIYLAFPHSRFRPTYHLVDELRVAHRHVRGLAMPGTGVRLASESTARHIPDDGRTTWYGRDEFDLSAEPRFSDDPQRLGFGGTVIYVALQLAWWMAGDPIVLVGADFPLPQPERREPIGPVRMPDIAGGSAGDWVAAGPEHAAITDYSVRALEKAARLAQQHRRSIIDATRGGTLGLFPRAALDDVLAGRWTRSTRVA